MIRNLPYHTLHHNGLSIEGYSRAAVQTYWRVPEMKVGFDFGGQPWEFMGTPTWFVTHTHLDHVAALPVYVARRRMMKMDPPVIYLPAAAIDPVNRILQAYSRMDRGRLPCDLRAIAPGDEVELSRELVVSAHAVRHTVPAMGFIVWERRKKLKDEYLSLTGEQIRDLRLGGTEVSHEIRLPRVCYLGDSSIDGLDRNPDMYRADVLIMEMTFVAPDHTRDEIEKHGHIHLDDIVARAEKFQNEVIIASHFSTRYNTREVERLVEDKLPGCMGGRLYLWL
jgi:ribonuclease Z